MKRAGIATGYRRPRRHPSHPRPPPQTPYPICLSIILARLNNKFYRRKQALLWDIATLAKNCRSWNG